MSLYRSTLVALAAVVSLPGAAAAASHALRTQMGTFALARRGLGREATAAPALPAMVADLAADPNLVPPPPGRALLHFATGIGAGDQTILSTLGVEVHGHLPDDTLLVSLPDDGAGAQLAALARVAAVVPAPAWLAVDAALLASGPDGMALAPFPGDGTRTLILEATRPAEMAALCAEVAAVGGEVLEAAGDSRFVRVRLDAAATLHLLGSPRLLHVGLFRPPLPCNDREYGIVQAGVDGAHTSPIWDRGVRGQGQVVTVCDGAFNPATCFLSGAGKVLSVTYLNQPTPTQISDKMAHGTHVAGTVAGDKGGDGIYQSEDGEAPAASLVLQAIGVADNDYFQPPGDFAALLTPAATAGAGVHTNSWGANGNLYDVYSRSIDQAIYTQPNMVVTFANGNNGPAAGTLNLQVNAKNLIAVGAYDAAAPQDIASFQSRGPTADGRVRPHILLPGVQVVSASYAEACGLYVFSGTSQATPACAACAAMIRQYLGDGFYAAGSADPQSPVAPSAALVKAMLLSGTENMTGSGTGGDIPSNGQGFGRLNLSRALWFKESGPPTLWLKDGDADEALATGDSITFTLAVRAGGDLRAVLVWTDPPALAQASPTLVNDLDLAVQAPDGTVYLGNNMQAGASAAGGSPDRLNTEEMVELPGAAPGTYTVTVSGFSVPMGPQRFALAARGDLGDRPGPTAWQSAALAAGAPQDTDALALLRPTRAVAAGDAAISAAAGAGGGGIDIIDTAITCQTAGGAPGWAAAAALAARAAGRRRRRRLGAAQR